jgi:aminoglycoside phosphotransferase (APT) family kinase protein
MHQVTGIRRLTGGVASSVYALDVTDRGGTRHRLVVRCYVHSGIPSEHAPAVVEAEARTLHALEGSDVPSPQLVAADPSGKESGAPALLMTRLPGRMLLTPRDRESWTRQIACALPHIHALPVDTDSVMGPPDAVSLEPPDWARDAAIWRAAIAAAQQPAPSCERCFVHGDFQHFNFVWSREKLRGIVDWTFSGLGVPERDVGHCRLNFAILWGANAAEDFRRCYEAEAGRRTVAYWDLHAALGFLPGWGHIIQTQAGRRLRVDTPGINGRVEDLVRTILQRL